MQMQFGPEELLLDDSFYPVVRLYPERVTTLAGFHALQDRWQDIVLRRERFAVVSFGDHPDDEPYEVRHERALFFKRQRDVFRDQVAVIVNVEPDAALRESRREEAAKAIQALGFTIAIVGSEEEAFQIARRHLEKPGGCL